MKKLLRSRDGTSVVNVARGITYKLVKEALGECALSMWEGDVYDIGGGLILCVCFKCDCGFICVINDGEAKVINHLMWDEIDQIPGMPFSWDVPF